MAHSNIVACGGLACLIFYLRTDKISTFIWCRWILVIFQPHSTHRIFLEEFSYSLVVEEPTTVMTLVQFASLLCAAAQSPRPCCRLTCTSERFCLLTWREVNGRVFSAQSRFQEMHAQESKHKAGPALICPQAHQLSGWADESRLVASCGSSTHVKWMVAVTTAYWTSHAGGRQWSSTRPCLNMSSHITFYLFFHFQSFERRELCPFFTDWIIFAVRGGGFGPMQLPLLTAGFAAVLACSCTPGLFGACLQAWSGVVGCAKRPENGDLFARSTLTYTCWFFFWGL